MGTSRTMTASAHKTPRRGRIPSYCDFVTHRPIDLLIMHRSL